MSNFVFEIFSEELPATLQKKIAIDYKQFAEKELKELKVEIKSDNIVIGITLNRLILKVENVEITKEQLSNFIDITLKNFAKTFPRTMCYPQLEVRWLRPIRGLFACIDNQVLEGKYYGAELKNGTYINKFDFAKCNSFEDYFDILHKEQIEIDYNKRLEFVKNEIGKESREQKKEYNNTKLMEEIAGMSEYCIEPMVSALDARFNILPFELIELVLRENQRYVVFNKNDKNEIKFLIFGDKITSDDGKRQNIIAGHKKVVNARLDDALYYWQLDKKEQEKFGGLEKYKAHLKKVLSIITFIDNITWGEYLKKQEEFAEKIIKNTDILEKTKQLIWDTKLDLATGVVEEFTELQGVIGGYYFSYQFNPYVIDKNAISLLKQEVLYYYLVDRMIYIHTMYFQGKQPTGSGDKYKVKARMDDIVELYVSGAIKQINDEQARNDKSEIRKLFLKRYQKYIEENYKNIDNIKQIAISCSKVIENKEWFDLTKSIASISNLKFVKTYKRINGYTKNIDFIESSNVIQKAKEIYKNDDIAYIDEFLDKNKIEGDNLVKQALKWIETKYFEPNLPAEFLEIM